MTNVLLNSLDNMDTFGQKDSGQQRCVSKIPTFGD